MARERVRQQSPTLADQVKEHACDPQVQDDPIEEPKLFLSTGSTLANLACSGRTDGGWPRGRISNLIGDTDTGKTVLAASSLAEGCADARFNDYRLLYLACEQDLASFPRAMFGNKFWERVEIFSHTNDDPSLRPPTTVEELHYLLMQLFSDGAPFVLALDSLDSLPSREELEKVNDQYEAWVKGKKTTGTMGMNKQKYLSQMFRDLRGEIEKGDSIFLVVSQVRYNIGSQYSQYTRSGGKALEFYCRIIAWMFRFYRKGWANEDKVRDRVIGRHVLFDVTKNHVTGKKRAAPHWLYDGFGVQDVRSMLDFLILEKILPKDSNGRIDLGTFCDLGGKWEGKRTVRDAVKHIHQWGLMDGLKETVQTVWDDIEADLDQGWEPKYD